MLQRRAIIAAASLLLVAVAPAHAADTVSADDTARFLAGLPPAPESALAPLTRERAWQQHASTLDTAFARLEQAQLARIRAWSSTNLSTTRSTVFYMFSGPDFLYANAFYPNAKTYVLAGLEPVGAVPDLAMLRGSVAPELGRLRASISSILSHTFFITNQMKSQLHAGRVNGTLPILYVFLARSGKTIRELTPVRLDDEGAVQTDIDAARASAARGVRIVFSGSDGEDRTLYYFSTNLADDGVKSSKFLKFCETLAPGDSLLKSASYLLHSGGFAKVREFLSAQSAAVVQDDSGIPLIFFDAQKWDLQPFGRYLGPISLFSGRYQPQYDALFRKSRPIDFGIGYRWRPNESNLLLAVKRSQDPVLEASGSVREDEGAEKKTSATAVPRAHRPGKRGDYRSVRSRLPAFLRGLLPR
jgi:hypothetical protein